MGAAFGNWSCEFLKPLPGIKCCAILPDLKGSAAHGFPGQSLAPFHSSFLLERCTERGWGIAGGWVMNGCHWPRGAVGHPDLMEKNISKVLH